MTGGIRPYRISAPPRGSEPRLAPKNRVLELTQISCAEPKAPDH
jgi:hypothetical protein